MILTPQSQLLERNIGMFEQGKWVIINPSDAYFLDQLKHLNITVMHQYFDIFSESVRVVPSLTFDSRDIAKQGFEVSQKIGSHEHIFTPFLRGEKTHNHALIFLPKAKSHFSMLLRMAAGLVGLGGQIHVVGENKGGIKSAAKLMQQFGATQKVDSARHCSLITTQVEHAHLAFEPEAWLQEDTYCLQDIEWPVVSMPGVFSHGELDKGTALLLDKHDTHLSGTVLDFACGAGVIGSYLKKSYPNVNFHFSDVSALAIYCTALTLAKNAQSATLFAANGLQGIEARVQHIVTNPPFHTGVKTDYTVTKRFIEDATKLLTQRGTLQMVANRFLPYTGLLSAHFSHVLTTAQTTQFSLYQAALS